MNSFKKIGYGGPCPPAGKPHRYFFKIYALDTALNLQPGASRQDLDAAMAIMPEIVADPQAISVALKP